MDRCEFSSGDFITLSWQVGQKLRSFMIRGYYVTLIQNKSLLPIALGRFAYCPQVWIKRNYADCNPAFCIVCACIDDI